MGCQIFFLFYSQKGHENLLLAVILHSGGGGSL
jgi:hypothetical protein